MLESDVASSARDVSAQAHGRFYTADWHPSNDASERIIASMRDHHVSHLRSPCHTHVFAFVAGETSIPFSPTITGMTNLTLSWNSRASYLDFMGVVEYEIETRVEVHIGFAGEDALLYRMLAIRYHASGRKNSASRAAVLALLPNGRW